MIDHYPLIRALHVVAALASGALFAARGVAMWSGSTVGMSVPVRWLSYAIDTMLLGAAVSLATTLHRVPVEDRWLTVKLALVLSYILLGSLALRRAPSMRARRLCFVAALLVFGAIWLVARDHGAARWAGFPGP